jgi:hypothetical protein
VRTLMLITLFAMLACPSSDALADGEDRRAVCPVMSAALAQMVAAQIKGTGTCKAFCKGCGCKGGPGFRAADGQCVGWGEVVKKCGAAPHKGCVAECRPVVAACVGQALGRAWLKTFAAAAGLDVSFQPAEVQEEAANGRTK